MNLSFDEIEAYYRVQYEKLRGKKEDLQACIDSKWLSRYFDKRLVLTREGDPPNADPVAALAETIVRHAPTPDARISDLLLRYCGTPEKAEAIIAAARETAVPIDVADASSPYKDKEGFAIHTSGPDEGKRIAKHRKNVDLALDKMGIEFLYDLFAERKVVKIGSWESIVTDAHVRRAWFEIDAEFKFHPPKDFFMEIVDDRARLNEFHPVLDYLDTLTWDGVARIGGPETSSWLTTYGGAEDSAYVRAVGRLWLIAAVRRVRQPGCKFDEMPVLESEQGTFKSAALRLLAVKDEWFSDSLTLDANPQRQMEALSGAWIIEVGELKGMNKTEIGALKAFLSRQIDAQRMAYGREKEIRPRQCVLIGTTNESLYLRDPTGDRRTWPVRVSVFDLAALARDRDQIWAEAAHYEALGESIRLSPSLYADAADEQDARRTTDPFEDAFARALVDVVGYIHTDELWGILGITGVEATPQQMTRFGESLSKLGWKRNRRRNGNQGRTYVYERGTPAERSVRVRMKNSREVAIMPVVGKN